MYALSVRGHQICGLIRRRGSAGLTEDSRRVEHLSLPVYSQTQSFSSPHQGVLPDPFPREEAAYDAEDSPLEARLDVHVVRHEADGPGLGTDGPAGRQDHLEQLRVRAEDLELRELGGVLGGRVHEGLEGLAAERDSP